jgi:hypothetical protein
MQKSVLLGLVEPVDFIHEQNGLSAVQAQLLTGGVNDRANVFDSRKDRRKVGEMRPGLAGNDSGQRGFTATRRTPQDHRKDLVIFDGPTDQGPLADQVLLADELGEVARTHAFGQGSRRVKGRPGSIVEQIGHENGPILKKNRNHPLRSIP